MIKNCGDYVGILDGGFALLSAAASGNEVVKGIFVREQIGDMIMHILNRDGSESIIAMYDAIRVLLTPDDDRVITSQVYGYARSFDEIGIPEALIRSVESIPSFSILASAIGALNAMAVSDKICKSIAEGGGIDLVLDCVDACGKQSNSKVAIECCSLLSKVAENDSTKITIGERHGLNRLMKLSQYFSNDAMVAVEAGASGLINAMRKFSSSPQLQRISCLLIRSLVSTGENRDFLLEEGVENFVRKARQSHPSCREVATETLRCLGVQP